MCSCVCLCVCVEFSDVTGHVDDRDATTWNSATTTTSDSNSSRPTAAAAAADAVGCVNDADDDDVDELSSSDVSSYTDVKHSNNLTSSTDDNIASCRLACHVPVAYTV